MCKGCPLERLFNLTDEEIYALIKLSEDIVSKAERKHRIDMQKALSYTPVDEYIERQVKDIWSS